MPLEIKVLCKGRPSPLQTEIWTCFAGRWLLQGSGRRSDTSFKGQRKETSPKKQTKEFNFVVASFQDHLRLFLKEESGREALVFGLPAVIIPVRGGETLTPNGWRSLRVGIYEFIGVPEG
jgi:hypothetical protein